MDSEHKIVLESVLNAIDGRLRIEGSIHRLELWNLIQKLSLGGLFDRRIALTSRLVEWMNKKGAIRHYRGWQFIPLVLFVLVLVLVLSETVLVLEGKYWDLVDKRAKSSSVTSR